MFIADLHSQDTEVPEIEPSSWFPLHTGYSGKWLVAGDLLGDGGLEFVSARNDSQAIVSMAAYRQNGDILWTFGEDGAGSADICYDLPLQIFDINNDGKSEVICGILGYLLVLEGATGREISRFILPMGLKVADCITFANLSHPNTENKSDIIIKDRYSQVWAYTADWKLLWTWKPKMGIKTCHHPTPIDINNDGFDEVLVGNELVDRNGKSLWTIRSRNARKRGHLDSAHIVQKGERPNDFRIIFTYCGSEYLAMMDGTGKILWHRKGKHFESVDVGRYNNDYPGPQFYSDIDHTQYGLMEGMFVDFHGKKMGTLKYDTGRFHRSLDWNGDGCDEVVIGSILSLVNGKGQRLGRFQFKSPIEGKNKVDIADPERFLVSIVDITGKGNGDVVIHSETAVNIYKNPSTVFRNQERFDSVNFTFY